MLLHSSHEGNILGGLLHEIFENLPISEKLAAFMTHFILDSLNIFSILFVVMFAVFYLQTYVNMDSLRNRLAQLKNLWVYLLAMVMGMVSPFCSCSIVPVLMGLISVGVPMPVCLCVLTSASLINLTALTALYSLTGSVFASTYLVCALLIILLSSVLLARLDLTNGSKEYSLAHCHGHEHDMDTHQLSGRLKLSLHSTWHVIQGAWFYILLGITLSAGLEAFFPLEVIGEVVSNNTVISTTIAAFVGFPIHSDVFTIMPILRLLKDIYPPVALTFTLSTMVVSIPSIILLGRVLKPKIIGIYTGILAGLTLVMGYLLIPVMSFL